MQGRNRIVGKQEYFQKYEVLPQDLEVVTFVDPAISQKQEADNTAIVTIGLHRQSNNIYVLDTDYGHFLPDEIIDKVFKKNIAGRVLLGISNDDYMSKMGTGLINSARTEFFDSTKSDWYDREQEVMLAMFSFAGENLL